ncbi:MAG: MvaI/BcnI family restriction endonuclease, partial [Dehalococcoidia bacterium]|nr:MvaI/BcnI family restriction endonuclease [Dehalococcoidia bacterium]
MTNLSEIRELLQRYGLRHLYGKILATNDNSKQQIYLGQSYGILQGLPFELRDIPLPTGRAQLYGWPRFSWMNDAGDLASAPQTKFILYPQYPEVRLSGFLRGAKFGPDSLRQRPARDYPPRCLLLGVTDDGQIIGYVGAAPDPLVDEVAALLGSDAHVALREIEFDVELDARTDLLRRLRAIHLMGWISGRRHTRNGTIAYNSRNGGGYTLEAMFGISSNGIGEPDFRGWELKQHAGSVITLLTPEPTSGFYREHGPEAFVRRYGYADKNGEPDRLNFGGIYRMGQRHETTGLTLSLEGFDAA